MIDDTETDASSGDSRTGYAEDRYAEDDASSGDSAHDEPEDRYAEAVSGGEGAGGAPGPESPEEPPVHAAERKRLLERRAELVQRRNVIMLGKARDDYNRMIERIDRRLGATGRRRQPTG